MEITKGNRQTDHSSLHIHSYQWLARVIRKGGGHELIEKEGFRLKEWDMYVFRIHILNFGRGRR